MVDGSSPVSGRVGVIHQTGGEFGLNDDVFIVSFLATPNAAGPDSIAAGCTFADTQGLWTVRVTVTSVAGAVLSPDDRTPIVQVGASYGLEHPGPVVSAIDTYDPIASTGPKGSAYHIVYTARSDTGQAAVIRQTKLAGTCAQR